MRNTRSAWPTPVTRSKVTAVALVAPTVPARVAVRAGAAAAVGVRAARTEPGAVTASVAISTASTIRRASLGDLIARDTSTRSGSRQHFRGGGPPSCKMKCPTARIMLPLPGAPASADAGFVPTIGWRSMVARTLRVVLWLACALIAAAFLFVAVRRLTGQGPLDGVEASVLEHATRIAGQQ